MALIKENHVWHKVYYEPVKRFDMQYKQSRFVYNCNLYTNTFSLLNALLKKTLKLSTGGAVAFRG